MGSMRMTRRHLLGSAALAALIALTHGAAALGEPIQYEYGGVITVADPSTGASPGTRFEGSFTYDPAVMPAYIAIEGSNQYVYGGFGSPLGSQSGGYGIDLRVGGQTVLGNPGGVQVAVFESEYPGQYGYRDAQGNPTGPFTQISISNGGVDRGPNFVGLTLINPGRSVFGSLDPPRALDLADFPSAKLLVVGDAASPSNHTLYEGTIDHLAAVPTPEPTTLAFFGVVVGGWALRLRRRCHA